MLLENLTGSFIWTRPSTNWQLMTRSNIPEWSFHPRLTKQTNANFILANKTSKDTTLKSNGFDPLTPLTHSSEDCHIGTAKPQQFQSYQKCDLSCESFEKLVYELFSVSHRYKHFNGTFTEHFEFQIATNTYMKDKTQANLQVLRCTFTGNFQLYLYRNRAEQLGTEAWILTCSAIALAPQSTFPFSPLQL